MAGYAKLWSGITESSLWSSSKEARLLFVTLLARADSTGFVEAAPSGLARIANLTREEVAVALEELTSPDPESKSTVADGRRVAVVPRGYCLVNYEEHRQRKDDDEKREYMREYMREYRKKKHLPSLVNSVNKRKTKLSEVGQAEAEAEAEEKAEAKTEQTQSGLRPATPSAVCVLDCLNSARKKAIPGARAIGANKASLEHIEARLKDGYTEDDCRHVIDVCAAEVRKDPSTAKWFNTVSPFRKDNFARKLGGDPDSLAATGHANAPTYGAIEEVGDMTHLLGDFVAQK